MKLAYPKRTCGFLSLLLASSAFCLPQGARAQAPSAQTHQPLSELNSAFPEMTEMEVLLWGRYFYRFDLDRLAQATDRVRAAATFPAIAEAEALRLPEGTVLVDAPESIQLLFNQICRFVFGRDDVLRLRRVRGSDRPDYPVEIDVRTMTVYLHVDDPRALWPDLAPSARLSALAFLIAHEISHYVYERSVDLSLDHRSPHGRSSLLRDLERQANEIDPSSPEGLYRWSQAVLRGSIAHSEVDAFAISILQSMRIDQSGVIPVFRYFLEELRAQSRREPAPSVFIQSAVLRLGSAIRTVGRPGN